MDRDDSFISEPALAEFTLPVDGVGTGAGAAIASPALYKTKLVTIITEIITVKYDKIFPILFILFSCASRVYVFNWAYIN
jgi:hypothetical protein